LIPTWTWVSKTLRGDVVPSMNQYLRKVIHTQLSDIG